MGTARILLSFDLLRDVLALPAAARITAAVTSTRPSVADACELTIEHHDFPETDTPPLLTPTFVTHVQRVAVFHSWGKPLEEP